MTEYSGRVFSNYLHPDAKRKYKVFFTKEGKEAINKALTSFTKMLDVAKDRMVGNEIEEGLQIYLQKKSKSDECTWSPEEYKHVGFQYNYLLYKSLQRYSENYNLCVTAFNKGLIPKKKVITAVSLGGGPGFELLAFRDVLSKYQPETEVKMTTLDPIDWSKYSNVVDINYVNYKIDDTLDFNFDVAILSYVAFAYVNDAESVKKIDSLFANNKLQTLLVNSRYKKLYMSDHFTNNLHYLHRYKDDRALAITSDSFKKEELSYIKKPFLNVIY